MKMADMKLPKKTKEELKVDTSPAMPEQERWPYGLQLRFETEQIDKLPHLKTYKIGQKVLVQAEGEVTELRMSERKEGKESWTVEVQLHNVGCESKKKEPSDSMMDAMRGVRQGRKL
jgi:hypothetical protein